ncbi:sugar phosphate nucleotidyltransferase [Tuwongella immobilis]|uniref:glucose-1-phosphate thymidylyltransferase n=1 Tax=Tuwongella immobilis TaxID=692036 RepID=A0A6C2YRF2_9BACT|nr:sugar phosphate nucleotidyltransferase [Tuwongella immobilis]VIP03452.1 spore coat protein : Nucleotidyl transferase OS=Alicyclobacillus acidocaldarius LAA1 GN=AaLAA1DRAFT_0014 PE=4 SV=1: NTP_transferase [Tuwongella immobilis]VTS04276.1 spore coat protein : Nucleotidyl transferase OS=Alicyclobacillus acidocaldarius LAA1 GN=AaLAA1DRAFT_0014 PE=4 SV=1: NTP_transferase [Tuwongella immobilis]
METRGVVLAGGKGTRLGELTKVTNKHLLPVGPYPMVYHPLKKLVGAGIRDVLLVSGTEHMGDFVELLGSGGSYGCSLTYRVQDEAGGIAQALGLAELFCHGARAVVILGDNIFQASLRPILEIANQRPNDAFIGIKQVPDPGRYGVAELDGDRVLSIEEKPAKPKSDFAVVGIYIYPPDVFQVIKTLKPSARGELEITDVNNHYLRQGRLGSAVLDGYWTDAGTLDSLDYANQLVRDQPPSFD